MTRIVFLTALTALVGCNKDECDDTAAGACDTGAEEVEEEEEEEEEVTTDSCSWTDTCVEPNEGDNQAWCTGLGDWATYSADACPTDGIVGTCELPAGGDYTAAATAYYYGGDDPEGTCTGAGGTYTAS